MARVILIAGPSGSGKSYVARRTGLPVLCLDDFYREADDPALPCKGGRVDWESPLAWDAAAALTAIGDLCHAGRAEVPIYRIGASRRVGHRRLDLGGSGFFVAEGIFAAEIVTECHDSGLLAGAFALRRPRSVNYVRRLARDLTERRKPAPVLVRRGITLLLTEAAVLARAEQLGAEPASARRILDRVQRLHLP